MSGLRGQFSSSLGFILAAAGSAVGIGNLVGFPVMAAKNGGAVFLVIYLAFVALVCFPVMLAEIAMGRASQKNPVGAFAALSGNSRPWRLVGGLAVVTPFMIAVFYTVITTWIVLFMFEILRGNLGVLAEANSFARYVSSPVLFLFAAPLMGLLFFILSGGVRGGIERAARVLMPMLFVLLILLVLFVLTLNGAVAGLRFYLLPDFSRLSSSVVNGALNQAFFSLSLGMGILITYGSYFARTDRVVFSTRLVAVTDTTVAFVAGLLVLPAIFAMNPTIRPDDLDESSIGMIFNFLPRIFLEMQSIIGYLGASLVALVFFLLVFFAALTSLVSISEVPVAWMMDEKHFPRRKALVYMAAGMVLFVVPAMLSFGMAESLTAFVRYGGLDKSFFDLIYDVFYETVLPLVGFTVCIFTSFRWKRHQLNKELAQGDAGYPNSILSCYVNLSLGTFIPAILLAVFLNNVAQIFFDYNLLGF